MAVPVHPVALADIVHQAGMDCHVGQWRSPGSGDAADFMHNREQALAAVRAGP